MQKLALFLASLIVIAACTPAGYSRNQSPRDESSQPTSPKRVTLSVVGDPPTLNYRLNTSGTGNVPGVNALEQMVHAGLGVFDDQGVLRARVAEALPTIENGAWRVFSDGRMETTWKIRPGVFWHDGTPFTSADLAFTAQVGANKETSLEYVLAYDYVDRYEATDALTFTMYWSKPFIGADEMFTSGAGGGRMLAIPRHVLEAPFNERKATFTEHPYWTLEYIGVGPYKVKEWVRGSHIVLTVNDQYVLGRPRIDEVEVKFLADARVVGASILAGVVQGTIGRGPNLEQAVEIRDQWRDGTMEIRPNNTMVVLPQFLDPTPAVITNVDFRRAMLYAIDRQELAATMLSGLTQPAESYLAPDDPLFKELESFNVRYEYNPTRSAQLIEGLGYTKDGEGLYRDSAGQRLAVGIQTAGGEELPERSALAVADYWQRAGVTSEPFFIPAQQQRDRELRSTFRGFRIQSNPNEPGRLLRYQSSQTPLPENNFLGDNHPRYRNAELDRLIDRYFTTIPTRERNQVLGGILRHLTDQLVLMGLFYNIEATMVSNRLDNLHATHLSATQAWNAHEWDLK